ncbi:type VI secretion system baseplate subunit TssG [Ningiella sp. W23]|uniref:type VI secretion system baseplate subunit TssG n=1 Tax=Ningiella sp. W23 TaxID=3023715 RepID=UPI0037581AAB
MGQRAGPESSVLIKEVLKQPRKYSFLRVVEAFLSAQKSPQQKTNEQARSFDQKRIDQDLLFRANPSMGFPSSDIDSISQSESGKHELVVNFMGLYGPSSPLPDFYTQAIIDEQLQVDVLELSTFYLSSLKELNAYREKRLDIAACKKRAVSDKQKLASKALTKIVLSPNQLSRISNNERPERVLTSQQIEDVRYGRALIEVHHVPRSNQRDFLDVFNHRLISLYLDAANKYHPHRYLSSRGDYIPDTLLSLIGAPSDSIRKSSAIKWRKLLPYAGLLSLQQGSAQTIEKVIAGYFSLPLQSVKVEEHVLRSVVISEQQRSLVGSQSFTLGSDIVCGGKVSDRMSKFRLHLLDLSIEQFNELLPLKDKRRDKATGAFSRYQELKSLLIFVKAPEQLADVCLHLHEKQKLSFNLNTKTPTSLGFSGWLNPPSKMPRSVVI